MAAAAKFPISRAVSDCTLKIEITGLRIFRFRLWLASLFFKVGVAIIGCRAEIVKN